MNMTVLNVYGHTQSNVSKMFLFYQLSVTNNSFFENKIFINHIQFIFKLYVSKSREKKFININNLIAEIRKVKRIEKEIALIDSKKTIAFRKKMAFSRQRNFNNINVLCSKDFDEKPDKLRVKNHSEKWGGFLFYLLFCFVCVSFCFFLLLPMLLFVLILQLFYFSKFYFTL